VGVAEAGEKCIPCPEEYPRTGLEAGKANYDIGKIEFGLAGGLEMANLYGGDSSRRQLPYHKRK